MDPLEIIWKWLQSNYGKLVFLAIVVLIAIIIDKALTRVVRKILDRSQVSYGCWRWRPCCSRYSA